MRINNVKINNYSLARKNTANFVQIFDSSVYQLDLFHFLAKQKLLSMEHKLLKTQICVSECDLPDEEASNSSTVSSQCTVTVHGLKCSDKEEAIDCLELYFGQDRKGSGGGEIVKDGIQIMKGKGIITFADSKG